MAVEGKDPDAQLEPGGCSAELRERLQARSGGSSFDHSEWYDPSIRIRAQRTATEMLFGYAPRPPPS